MFLLKLKKRKEYIVEVNGSSVFMSLTNKHYLITIFMVDLEDIYAFDFLFLTIMKFYYIS